MRLFGGTGKISDGAGVKENWVEHRHEFVFMTDSRVNKNTMEMCFGAMKCRVDIQYVRTPSHVFIENEVVDI